MSNEMKLRPAYRSFWRGWIAIAFGLSLVFATQGWVELIEAFGQGEIDFGAGEGFAAAMNIARGAGVLIILYFGWNSILYPVLANRYFVTTSKVKEINGLLKKEEREIRLVHVRSTGVDIGYVGHIISLLGFKPFGDLVFYTAGSGDDDVVFKNVLDPNRLKDQIENQESVSLENADPSDPNDSGDGPGGEPGRPGANVRQQLKEHADEIEELKERGRALERQVASLTSQMNRLLMKSSNAQPQEETQFSTPEVEQEDEEIPQWDNSKSFTAETLKKEQPRATSTKTQPQSTKQQAPVQSEPPAPRQERPPQPPAPKVEPTPSIAKKRASQKDADDDDEFVGLAAPRKRT